MKKRLKKKNEKDKTDVEETSEKKQKKSFIVEWIVFIFSISVVSISLV